MDSLSFLLDGIPPEIWLHHIFPYLIGGWMSVSKSYFSLAVTVAFSSPRVSHYDMLQVFHAIIERDDKELLEVAINGSNFEDVTEKEFNSGVFIATSNNSHQCMPLLLQNKKIDEDSHKFVVEATRSGNIQVLRQLLAQSNLKFHNSVVLFLAAKCGQLEAIKVLLEDDRDLQVQQYTFISMLNEAITSGHSDVVEYFLNSAYLTYIDSAVYAAINAHRVDFVERLFQDPRVSLLPDMLLTAIGDDVPECVELFLNYGIVPAEVDLMETVLCNSVKSLPILLKDGRVDPTSKNYEVLRCAINFKKKDIVEILLADPRIQIEDLDQGLKAQLDAL